MEEVVATYVVDRKYVMALEKIRQWAIELAPWKEERSRHHEASVSISNILDGTGRISWLKYIEYGQDSISVRYRDHYVIINGDGFYTSYHYHQDYICDKETHDLNSDEFYSVHEYAAKAICELVANWDYIRLPFSKEIKEKFWFYNRRVHDAEAAKKAIENIDSFEP